MALFKRETAQELTRIIDHPLINMGDDDYLRIQRNRAFYSARFDPVTYRDSNGDYFERTPHSINVAKIVSRKLSKLVFNEGVEINIGDDQAQEYIDDVFKANSFDKTFGEELEGGYAVSGLAIRPVYDEARGMIKFTYCSADNFFPLNGNSNTVDEAAISTVYTTVENDRNVWYTHLEFHLRTMVGYRVLNELYRSEDINVTGEQVPLTKYAGTADLQEVVELEGFTKPLFTYIKLAGKNNFVYGSPVGLGVIDNARGQLEDINEKYDLFMCELENSRRKIMASDHFFKVEYDAQGRPKRKFDSGTDVFQSLAGDDETITEFAPQLRSAEFIESINFILRIIEVQVGFSAGTFSFDGQSVKTATEIISENTETYQTRSDNVLIIETCLENLIISVLELSYAMGLYRGNIDPDIEVSFDDGVFESKDASLDYMTKALTAGIMSKRTAMITQFDLTEEQAEEEFARIVEETQMNDPIFGQVQAENDMFGANENNGGNTGGTDPEIPE